MASKTRRKGPKRDKSIDDEEFDGYYHTRLELKTSGHNLTSVLINPRQTKLGGMFDSFSQEQSAPLESMLPPDDPNEGKETKLKPKTLIGMFNSSLSQLSSHAMSTHSSVMPSSHSVATAYSSSSHSTAGPVSTSAVLLSISSFENNQLEAMAARLRNLFLPYENLHTNNYNYNQNTEEIASYDTENAYSPVDTNGRMRRTSSGDENEVLIVTNRMKSQESLRQCYEAIPEMFFSSEALECSNDEQFHNIYGDFDVNILIELIKLSHVESNTAPSPTRASAKANKVNVLRLRQNKLSSYLDIIDLTLQRVLYLHSPVFFRTLHTVEALRQEVSLSLDGVVRCSRDRLRVCDDNVTAVGRAIPRLLEKKEKLKGVIALLEKVKLIKEYRDNVVLSMKRGEYIQALEQISAVKNVIKGEGADCLRMEPVRLMDIQLDAYSTQCCNNLNRLFEMEYGGGNER